MTFRFTRDVGINQASIKRTAALKKTGLYLFGRGRGGTRGFEPASIRLNTVLKMRGLDIPTLATKLGLSLFTIEQIARGRGRGTMIPRRIEAALDAAIWTAPALFRFRKRVSKWFGLNIYTTHLHPLRKAVRKSHGIALDTAHLSRVGAEATLEAAFMNAKPKHRKEPKK